MESPTPTDTAAPPPATLPYRHTTPAVALFVTLGIIAGIFYVILAFVADAYTWRTAGVSGGLVIVAVVLWMHSLTVRVTPEVVRVSYGFGWPRFTWRIADIVEAETTRMPWYYGYGIRLTPKGWMFNVSGPTCVRLTKRDGSHRIIGTNDPVGLLHAIAAAQNQPPA